MTKTTISNMTDKLFEKSWQCIEDLGLEMQQLVNEESWSNIAEIAVRRHQAVVKHFNEFPVCPERAVFYKSHLSDFLKQEEQFKNVVQQAREKVLKGVVNINQGKRAVSAYTNSAKPV